MGFITSNQRAVDIKENHPKSLQAKLISAVRTS